MKTAVLKRCYKCGESKDFSAFNKSARSSDGFQPSCRACAKIYAAANRDKIAEKAKAYYGENKERYAENGKEWRAKNPDRAAAAAARRYQEQKQKFDARNTAWARSHPEARSAIYQKWSRANRPIINAIKAKRKAALERAIPAWADPLKIADFYEAAHALTRETGQEHHVDHIIPLVSELVCGLHCEANLQVLPGVDNQKKGNRQWPNMP